MSERKLASIQKITDIQPIGRNCTSCAHKEYCELGAECVNKNYQYHFPYSKVRESDGSFTYSLSGGWS